jgi:2-keto-4-pentenoate hydratase/2-oxohepta-3-ene-1,7-dioic acid hydratase in catechol pathway
VRLASFEVGGNVSWGMVDGGMAIDIGAVLGARLPTLKAYLADGSIEEIRDAARDAPHVPLDAISWLPVVPDAGKILCIGHNYESHRQETGRARVGYPSIFTRFADTQVGHGQPIRRPPESTNLDFEGELAVVIGKGGRRIVKEQALDHIAGYSCFNDASIRDWQWHTQQFTPGKNFPATGSSGPWLTTADEVGDPARLIITTLLNDEIMQSAPTSDMIFDVPTIIAYVSTFTSLSAGDVICTGTPGGVGAKREPAIWMKAGDLIEVDISGVGHLHNIVQDEG